jgi:pimeloyl-ACP methyl ester carboxylesterase
VTPRRITALVLFVSLVALAFLYDRPPAATGQWMQAAGVSPAFQTVVVRGRPLAVRYVRRGAGPPVVLVHGIGSSLFTWRKVLPALATDHDVVALDLPGFGGSDVPGNLTSPVLVGAVLGLLDALRLERVSLVGSSLGGGVSAAITAEHPERVEKLALLDSVGFFAGEKDYPQTLRLTERFGGLLDYLPLRRLVVRKAVGEVFYDPSLATREEVDEHVAPFARPGAIAAVRSLLFSYPSEAEALQREIRSIRRPVLILWGREDRWIPVAHADLFKAAIPNSRVQVLERCGHLPQEERPDEVAPILKAFLSPGSAGN